MPDSPLTTPGPYHILSYGLLFGTQLFHSFISGPLAFKTLSRPQFAHLQSVVFPVYFGMQTLLPLVLALSFPGKAIGLTSTGAVLREGLFEAGARREAWALGVLGVCGLVNWALVGPATTRIMRERKGQEVRDGKKSYDAGPQSEAMKVLNRRFGRLHGVSSLVNLVAVLVTGWYGVVLAERL